MRTRKSQIVIVLAVGVGALPLVGQNTATSPLSSKPGNVAFLVPFDDLARVAHQTGNNYNYAAQSIKLLAGHGLDEGIVAQLARRVEYAEDKHRTKQGDGPTDEDVATAFNHLAAELSQKPLFSVVTPQAVHDLRITLAAYSPNLFIVKDHICSPIEAGLVLFLAIYNNGNLQRVSGSKTDPPSSETQTLSVSGGLRPRTDSPNCFMSLRTKLSELSPIQLQAWLEEILQRLKI